MSDWVKGAGWLADGMGILAGDKFRLERVWLEEQHGDGDRRLDCVFCTQFRVWFDLAGFFGFYGLTWKVKYDSDRE
jgi:hypothetical protein